MQSSRWAPTHRRGASTAPSTNAAILGFKEDPSLSSSPSVNDILSNKVSVQQTAYSVAPPPAVVESVQTSTAPAQASAPLPTQAQAQAQPSKPVTTFSTTINPQAPAFVPGMAATAAAVRTMPVSLPPYSPMTFSPAPLHTMMQAVPMPEPAPAQISPVDEPVDVRVQEPVPEPTPLVKSDPIPPQTSVPTTTFEPPLPPALQGPRSPVRQTAYADADPYAQTGGEANDLFFGDDFTPIARPVPQPISQPAPEPPQAQPQPQTQSSPIDEPKSEQRFYNQRSERVERNERPERGGGRRGRGRGRGEGRGRRDRGGRGRGGRDFSGNTNRDVPANNTLPQPPPRKNGRHKSTTPPAASDDNRSPTDVSAPALDVNTTAPADAPTGPSKPGPTPAVRGDRSATGGVMRPKLTEEELSAKLAAVRLRNEEREKAHKAAAEDEAVFRAQEERASKEAAARRKEEEKERRELMQERERNRVRKMKKMGGREWDEGKEQADLLEGTDGGSGGGGSRWGYGNGFRGRGHYRRGAHGAISGFAGVQRNGHETGPDGQQQQSSLEGRDEPTHWRTERSEPRFGRNRDGGGGDNAGRMGRGNGRGGRGGGGRGAGGRGGHKANVLSMTTSDFPALGGGKTQAARAAVEEAMKVHKQESNAITVVDVHSPKETTGSNVTTTTTTTKTANYAAAAKPRHARKFAVDEPMGKKDKTTTMIATTATTQQPSPQLADVKQQVPPPVSTSWADQVEEGM